jgi:NADH-quinone oxidoreductase subunit M
VILSATYMLWMFQRVNYGPVTNDKNRSLPDLSVREWIVIAPIVATAVLMGVVPNLFLRPIGPAVERMLNQVQRNQSVQAQLHPRGTALPIVVHSPVPNPDTRR